MKNGRCLLWILFWLSGLSSAQVGINTTDPRALLDIHTANPQSPEITDGILIPRVDNFPSPPPTPAQDGMLLYLKSAREAFPRGFYFWDAAGSTWAPISNTSLYTFFQEGSNIPAEGVTGGIFRRGNIGIGTEAPEARLSVVLPSDMEHRVRTAVEIDNSSSSPANVTYGILNNNRSLTNDRKYGIKTNVSADGKGVHYGIYNEVYQKTAEDMYGIYNKVGRTFGVTKNHYGIYTEIGTPLGTGFAYGLYSVAWGSVPERVFAGYFAGRLGIGADFDTHYVFPDTRGSSNQIMSLQDDGSLIWTYPHRAAFSATGTATGNYSIPEDTYTLRIDAPVGSISIPDASLNKGRILVLLAWNGIAAKPLVFVTGEDLWDVGTAASINSISGGERLTIQSDGNRWLLLNRE